MQSPMAPTLATCSRGSVQQGLSAAGGALGFYRLGLSADKRYSLGPDNTRKSPSFVNRIDESLNAAAPTIGV